MAQSNLLDLIDLLHKVAETAAAVRNDYANMEAYTGPDEDETAAWTQAQEVMEACEDLLYMDETAGSLEEKAQLVTDALEQE
jgi:hypothetical protein